MWPRGYHTGSLKRAPVSRASVVRREANRTFETATCSPPGAQWVCNFPDWFSSIGNRISNFDENLDESRCSLSLPTMLMSPTFTDSYVLGQA